LQRETVLQVNSKSSDQHGDERDGAVGETLGVQLRRAREARNLTLREVSDQTRITRRHLEAIESDDYKQLPGGIFNRSFVKAFARAVGYGEDEAVRAYQKVARESGESFDDAPPTTRQASRIYMDDAPSRSPLLTALLSLVILAVISLAAYAGLHYYHRTEVGSRPQQATTAPARANPAASPAADTTQSAPAATVTSAVAGLKVSVRAKGEDIWMRTSIDANPPTDGTLKTDQVKEVNAEQSLKLEYARVKAAALEVTINGRPALVPSEAKPGKLVEFLITKDNYESLLQHP
jgi:cytoskeletal protein RodZ